jgi:hypothetical protein
MFSLENLSVKNKMKVKRILYGHKTRKVVKGKVYENIKKGIVEELHGLRIGPGTVMIHQKDIPIFENELEKLKLSFKIVDIWLTKDALRRMRA